jgi:hypothetical protein
MTSEAVRDWLIAREARAAGRYVELPGPHNRAFRRADERFRLACLRGRKIKPPEAK